MSANLDVISVGMVTAVGLDAPSSCAAMRAKLDGFQETKFHRLGDEFVIGAPVPLPREWIGEKRMAHLAAAALTEAIGDHEWLPDKTAVLLCIAEENRPGRPIRDVPSFLSHVSRITGHDISQGCITVAHGRPSGLVALDKARKIFKEGNASSILIIGVDSYLTPATITHYIAKWRLLTSDNPNGFIPGEAAAAILCSNVERGQLQLAGVGLARERASIYNNDDIPLRGDGMTSAYNIALTEAGIPMNDIGYRISDLIGEKYWFKQTALANLRLSRGPRDFIDLWSPGEFLGNVGAAAVPAMIAMARTAACKGYGYGNSVLVEASNDAGACGAAVLTSRIS